MSRCVVQGRCEGCGVAVGEAAQRAACRVVQGRREGCGVPVGEAAQRAACRVVHARVVVQRAAFTVQRSGTTKAAQFTARAGKSRSAQEALVRGACLLRCRVRRTTRQPTQNCGSTRKS